MHVADAWIKASPSGMTSGFAQLQNTGDKDLALVSVSSDIAGSIELHEMTGSGTSMSMTQLEGPLAIPANTTVTLEPGAQHIMLMDLKKELQAGTTATLLLTFADKSTQDVEFEIKEFSGAKESYAPDAEHQGHNEPGEHGDH
jgi:copper(I)-binding protein